MADRYWPLGVGRIVTSPYGPRDSGFHAGADFGRRGGSAGMPVYAIQAGTVRYAGAADGYGGPDPAGWLVVDSVGGACWEYGHIVRLPHIRVGSTVVAGQQIAVVNANQRTNAGVDPHLHLSYMPSGYNPRAKTDPVQALRGALEPGVTAPTPSQPEVTPVSSVKTYSRNGDPTWLEEVARDCLGDRLRVMPGWKSRGHGDFKDVRGIMWHHTGNRQATPESIRDGRPDLRGPLSNFHISWEGTVTLIAVGVCWHAGQGSYPWLPTNMGNWHMIGVECSWPTIHPDGSYDEHELWTDESIIAQRDLAAGLTLALGVGEERNIDHKEYAGAAQGKWDRGNLDPDWFRGEVGKDMRGLFGGTPPKPSPPVVLPPAGGFAHVLLYAGMRGDDVRKLQTRLKRNYSKLVVDGIFGPHTKACVIDYQRTRTPPLDPDGIVGPATAASLQLYL